MEMYFIFLQMQWGAMLLLHGKHTKEGPILQILVTLKSTQHVYQFQEIINPN